MVNVNRRGLLAGILACVAGPAIIRTSGLLMPIKPALVDMPSPTLQFVGTSWSGTTIIVPAHPAPEHYDIITVHGEDANGLKVSETIFAKPGQSITLNDFRFANFSTAVVTFSVSQ